MIETTKRSFISERYAAGKAWKQESELVMLEGMLPARFTREK